MSLKVNDSPISKLFTASAIFSCFFKPSHQPDGYLVGLPSAVSPVAAFVPPTASLASALKAVFSLSRSHPLRSNACFRFKTACFWIGLLRLCAVISTLSTAVKYNRAA